MRKMPSPHQLGKKKPKDGVMYHRHPMAHPIPWTDTFPPKATKRASFKSN